MKTIKWHLETGMQGAQWSGDIEVEDSATEEEIDAMVRDEVHNIISWTWWEDRTPQETVTENDHG